VETTPPPAVPSIRTTHPADRIFRRWSPDGRPDSSITGAGGNLWAKSTRKSHESKPATKAPNCPSVSTKCHSRQAVIRRNRDRAVRAPRLKPQ